MLLIRSQNLQVVVSLPAGYLQVKEIVVCFIPYTDPSTNISLGAYSTKERAIDVITEIIHANENCTQNHFIDYPSVAAAGWDVNSTYQMPLK